MNANIHFHYKKVAVGIVALLTIFFYSCSNDFLKQEQLSSKQITDTIFVTDQVATVAARFNLSGGNNAKWRVFQYPSWIKVVPSEGQFQNGESSFQLQQDLSNTAPQFGFFQLPLIFEVVGVGLVSYPLLYLKAGSPNVSIDPQTITLGYQTSTSFKFRNNYDGYFIWQLLEKPSWVKLTEESGTLEMGKEKSIGIEIIRDNLPRGNYSGEIKFKGNSANKDLNIKISIQVADETVNGNTIMLSGQVTDAEYYKPTDMLVISTKDPNRLYFIGENQTMKTMDLNKVPVSLAIPESGDFVAVMCSNTDLSLINPKTLSIEKNIETGVDFSDLALGNNGWAYLSRKQYDGYYLTNVNLETGQIVVGKAWANGLSYLKKVPGKPELLGTRVGYSPDGLLIFDISKGAARDTINEYHLDTWKFWLSESGDRMFCGIRKIYATPEFDQAKTYISSEQPLLKGELEAENWAIISIDHCAARNEFYVVLKNNNTYPATFKIDVYDVNGSYRKKTFLVDACNIPGTIHWLTTDAVPFIYSNKSGSSIYMIKKGDDFNDGVWFVESVNLR